MAEERKRRMKIYPKHFQRAYSRNVIFPEIRLCGKWLQDIGFKYGQQIIVKEEDNKIIITLEENN